MAIQTNTAEGGTNGVTVTAGNSGGASGTAFGTVGTGAGGAIIYSNEQAAHGTLSWKCTPGTGAQTMLWNQTGSGAVFSTRFYVYLTGYPSAETQWHLVQTSGGALVAGMNLTTAGKLKVFNSAATTLATFTNSVPLNTWTRITLFGTINATTGSVTAKMYPGDSLTATETQAFTNTNTGSTDAGRALFGKFTAAGTMVSYYLDDFAEDLTSSTEIAPPSNVAPTVSADTPVQAVAVSSTASLSYTAFDSDGSIASRATTFDFPTSSPPSLTGGTTSTPSFTTGTPAPKLYQVRQTVTDDQGATASAVAEVRVNTTGDVKPISGLAAAYTGGSWANVGGAADEATALNDASDATYVESATLTSTATEARLRLDPATVRANLSVTFRVAQDVAGTIVAKGRLYEGTTLRQEWTLTTTTSAADQVCALSAPTVAAITDWGNLYVALSGSV